MADLFEGKCDAPWCGQVSSALQHCPWCGKKFCPIHWGRTGGEMICEGCGLEEWKLEQAKITNIRELKEYAMSLDVVVGSNFTDWVVRHIREGESFEDISERIEAFAMKGGIFMSIKQGMITGYACDRKVYIEEKELKPNRSQLVWNHSPDGFNWGYGGSGPAQLALALLMEFTDKETAICHHHQFKFNVIARLEQDHDFILPISVVTSWLERRGAICNMENGE